MHYSPSHGAYIDSRETYVLGIIEGCIRDKMNIRSELDKCWCKGGCLGGLGDEWQKPTYKGLVKW